jgi:signal transduction histidine kinase
MQITLRKKAFAFFLLFELCMLVIFGVLLHLLYQAEAASLREERAKRVLGETQQLGLLFTKAGDGLILFCRSHDPANLEPFDLAAEELPEKCQWLRSQFADSPEDLAVFERVETSAISMMKTLKKVRNSVEGMDGLDSAALMMAARQKCQPTLDKMVKDTMELMQREQAIINANPERERRQRESNSQAVKVAFGAATLLAVLGLVVFLRDVLGRLSVMEQNTRLLAKGKPLMPALGGTDEIAHLDGVFHDMADALHEAQEVRKAFVAMVSHDLRSPLTAVSGYLELLEMGCMGDLTPAAQDGLTRARRNVQRLIRLINDLLDLEKMESGTIQLKLTDVSMKKVLDDSIEAVSVLAEGAKVTVEHEYGDFQLTADADRVVQVLVNLLSNAIKFSPEGASVRVTLTTRDDGFVEVRVADKGRGVPEKYRELIFERFKQVDESDHSAKGGTGLGLPICKAIVEQHGGSIGVDSSEGNGSEFWFTLPASPPQMVAGSPELVDSARI